MLQGPFANNKRLQFAASNSPPITRGETDQEAVRLLQSALVAAGTASLRQSLLPDGTFDGIYGGETVEAVKRFQEHKGIARDGVVGRQTLTLLAAEKPARPASPTIGTGSAAVPQSETPKTLGPSSLQMPTAATMYREYQKFVPLKGHICQQKDTIKSQCAIRMSFALMRSDIGFKFDYSKIQYTHKSHKHCGLTAEDFVEHNASATRLFAYLKTLWTFQKYPRQGSAGQSGQKIMDSIARSPGLIYFQNFHIDYWDGEKIMNEKLNYNAKAEPTKSLNYFIHQKVGEVWFLPISS